MIRITKTIVSGVNVHYTTDWLHGNIETIRENVAKWLRKDKSEVHFDYEEKEDKD